MHVFVTGASGFIAGTTIPALIRGGHTVTGLARSEEGAAKVAALGAKPVIGKLEDLDILRREAAAADATIHLAFNHDWTNYAASTEVDKIAIAAMCDALVGTNKAFIGTSGLLAVSGKHPGTEDTPGAGPRSEAEVLVQGYVAKGVRAAVIRLAPTCHGKGDRGFIAMLRDGARKAGQAIYIGDGQNQWPACHRDDVGELYALAIDKATPGAMYHAAAELVTVKDLMSAISRGLALPLISGTPGPDYGFIGHLLHMDCEVSSDKTRKELDWEPKGVNVLDDIALGHYFEDTRPSM